MFVLYNDVIFMKKDKTAVKKFAFQNDDTWQLPIHHQRSPLLSNSHRRSPVIDYYYRQAQKSDSLNFILVALRTLRVIPLPVYVGLSYPPGTSYTMYGALKRIISLELRHRSSVLIFSLRDFTL